MGLITWVKAVWDKLFKREIKERFNADILLSDTMEAWIEKFYNITGNIPPWLDPDDDIETINYAATIDDITAKWVTLNISITMPDTPRGKYLQKQADYILQKVQDKTSEALGNCGLMFKPNGKNVDYMEPGTFAPTETDSNGNILGCVFQFQIYRNDWTYTRLEWHRFEEIEGEDGQPMRVLRITNYAYKKQGKNSLYSSPGDPCSLTEVPEWANLQQDSYGYNIEAPIYGYFGNPAPNRFDRTSALKVPIWGNCMKELKDLDVAWSRKSTEVEDSKHITYLPSNTIRYADQHKVSLPRNVKGVELGNGTDADSSIHEHVSTLLTEQRITDINSILAMISTKCGFSQGTFVLDEKTGMMTATQVEADDRDTLETIKNIRKQLQDAILNCLYGVCKLMDVDPVLSAQYPAEPWTSNYELFKEKVESGFDFGDLTENKEEDRERGIRLATNGFTTKEYYLVQHEGFTEDEAVQMVAAVEQKEKEKMKVDFFGKEE